MKKGVGCLTVFGAIFFIAGIGIFLSGVSESYDVWRSQEWRPVMVELSSVEQTVSTDDEGSTTYGVEGRFQYEYQGQSYTSNQMSFYSGTDNIGGFQKNLYRKLNSAKKQNRPIRAYVNPEDPSEAVIDRTMRWGMLGFHSIFLLVFGGVGLGIIIASLRSGRKLNKQKALQAEHEAEPWLWKEEWQTNHFKSNTSRSFWFLLVFSIIWNVISVPAVIGVMNEGGLREEPAKLLVFLFPLVGIILLSSAVTLYLRHKKYGSSELIVEETPFAIGGTTSGELLINGPIEGNGEVMLSLTCQRKYQTGTGKNRTTRTTIIWQSDRRAYAENRYDGSHRLKFSFDIPKGVPQSNSKNPSDKIEWIFRAERKQPGVDLKLDYEVPAFNVAHREAIEPAEEDLFMSSSKQSSSGSGNGTMAGDWTRLGIVESVNNWGTSYTFPAFRHKGAALSTVLFGLIFSAIGIGSYFGDASIIFLIMFCLFGFVIFYFGLKFMLYKSEVTVGSGALHVANGMLGTGSKTKISRSEVADITSSTNMSVGNKSYYNVQAELTNGKKVAIAKYLTHTGDVDAFIHKLKQELGMQDKS
ncbi:DUF3592 domain-containing protein [Kangiella sediminilitoris]|uniref:DUF3592 domain-containing protein n=1 Tax=Kangiella sediminilitoris TaxID=1144748 RepID=A0A1B3BCK4_9GAMM|nr:DUF3592 domain-containing protein [Kangiella sediminilitoris]AOE50541.1 hypothetical protein KS2013_1832 [Kangiella sediminilitoris]